MEDKSKFGLYIDKKLEEKNMKVSEFIDKSMISKRNYYQLLKDDSILEIGQMQKVANLFDTSYLQLQVELGNVNTLETSFPINSDDVNNLIYANRAFLANYGLDINRLSNEEKKELATKLDIQLQMLAIFYSRK